MQVLLQDTGSQTVDKVTEGLKRLIGLELVCNIDVKE